LPSAFGCAGASDSSRIRHLCSSPSPRCPRSASRLAHHFCAGACIIIWWWLKR
jgi:hypothetical protein